MGYDTVRLIEHLPDDAARHARRSRRHPHPSDADAHLRRRQRRDDRSSRRLSGRRGCRPRMPMPQAASAHGPTSRRLDAPLPHAPLPARRPCRARRSRSPTPGGRLSWRWSRARRTTSWPAISFRSCSRSASRRHSTCRPLRFIAPFVALNPSPFLFHLDFGDFALVGSVPEILVRARDGASPSGRSPARAAAAPPTHEDNALEAELLADPKERAEHLMLLDLGRNDVGRVAAIGTVKVTDKLRSSSATATSCTSSRMCIGDLEPDHDASTR